MRSEVDPEKRSTARRSFYLTEKGQRGIAFHLSNKVGLSPQTLVGTNALVGVSIHGGSHLARIYENGLHLAESTGAKKKVVQLFAVLHDSRGCNESWDPKHGPRGAHLAESWRGKYFELSDDEFDLLYTSCNLHTKAKTHVDKTIQSCFALTLPRI